MTHLLSCGSSNSALQQPVSASRSLVASLIASLESTIRAPSSSRASESGPFKNTSPANGDIKQMAKLVVDRLAPRAVSYENELIRACELLSNLYQSESAFHQAAETLARIDLESGMRQVDVRVKLDKLLQICCLYLEDEQAAPDVRSVQSADDFIKKSSSLLSYLDEEKDAGLLLRYLSCSARILDRKNKFAEAGAKYYELYRKLENRSQEAFEGVFGKQEALSSAIACALLADPGPQRMSLLAKLYNDEGTASLEAFTILEKAFLERILLAEDLDAFRKALGRHHKNAGAMKWGLSVVDIAIMQHNLLGCSKIFATIKIESLAEVFNSSYDTALNIVSNMILDNRLLARVDQTEGVVSFVVDSCLPQSTEQWTESAAQHRAIPEEFSGNHAEECLSLADAAVAACVRKYGLEI